MIASLAPRNAASGALCVTSLQQSEASIAGERGRCRRCLAPASQTIGARHLGSRYPVTRGNVNTILTPPATFSAATVPPILAM